MANWLKRNGLNLLIAGTVLLAIYFGLLHGDSLAEQGRTVLLIFMVIAGIGFLIFFHELGHFLAAKACNVHVETFSVGFGPPIPGCHFKWGETTYKLAMIPIGGYVKMPGEYPSEQVDEAVANDPRSFMNKSVGQRMIIISAGVIMNVILGMVCFIYVYMAGKSEIVPRIEMVEAGSPAAIAGMEAGSELLQVDDNTKPTFEDLFYASALSRPNSTPIYFKWKTPRGEEREATIYTRKVKGSPKPMIGVGHPLSLKVVGNAKVGAGRPGTPAAQAGFQHGDVLLRVRPVVEKGQPAAEYQELNNGWDFSQAQYDFRHQAIEVEVRRGASTETVTVEPRYFKSFGLVLEAGPIVAIVDNPSYLPPSARQFLRDDVIVAFEGDRGFDPIRLPDLVMDKAAMADKLKFTVRRNGAEETIEIDAKEIRGRGTWNEQEPGRAGPVGIPALGIAYTIVPTIKGAVPGSEAARANFRAGDVIKKVKLTNPDTGKPTDYDLEGTHWPRLLLMLQAIGNQTVTFTIQENGGTGEERHVTLTAAEDKSWPYPHRGLVLQYDRKLVQTDSITEAISWGFRDTYRFIGRIYMNLRGLVLRDLDPELLSGPIEMVKMTYQMADQRFPDFILFLGVISINLAVVNFLPIPILDGGHMVFLIVEKIRRKPASERALVIANTIGLVLILSLMAFVLFLDFSKMDWVQKLF